MELKNTLRWATKRLHQPKLKVITAYTANDVVELDLNIGEIITLLETDENGWAEGCNETGRRGWFPYRNVEVYVEEKDTKDKEIPKEDTNPTTQISVHRRTLRRSGSGSFSKVIAPLQRRASKVLNKKEEWKRIETESILKNRPRISSKMEEFFTRRPTKADLEQKNILRTSHIDEEKQKTATLLSLFLENRTNSASRRRAITSPDSPGTSTYEVRSPEKDDSGKRKNLLNFFSKNKAEKKVYGVALEDYLENNYTNASIPILEQCVELLRGTALDEEGLFRVSGALQDVEALQKAAEKKTNICTLSVGPHAVASFLKKWLRELADPVIPFDSQAEFLKALSQPEDSIKLIFCDLIDILPPAHKTALQYIMGFLYELSLCCEKNKMTIHNISIVFGPTLMRPKDQSADFLAAVQSQSVDVVVFMLEHYNDLFGKKNVNTPKL